MYSKFLQDAKLLLVSCNCRIEAGCRASARAHAGQPHRNFEIRGNECGAPLEFGNLMTSPLHRIRSGYVASESSVEYEGQNDATPRLTGLDWRAIPPGCGQQEQDSDR